MPLRFLHLASHCLVAPVSQSGKVINTCLPEAQSFPGTEREEHVQGPSGAERVAVYGDDDAAAGG